MVLTNHLIERGYRSIGIIVGSKDHPDARVKMLGYQKALASHGIDADPNWIAEGFFQASETREATDILIRQRVRAIFCTSDMMAISAALHLQENGYEIPRDIAIAGYGGTIWAGIFSPKLTTVDAQVEQLGRAAVERLIHYLNHPVENPRLIIQPVYLRVGNTT
jgi:LacI family transcriptional regulator